MSTIINKPRQLLQKLRIFFQEYLQAHKTQACRNTTTYHFRNEYDIHSLSLHRPLSSN